MYFVFMFGIVELSSYSVDSCSFTNFNLSLFSDCYKALIIACVKVLGTKDIEYIAEIGKFSNICFSVLKFLINRDYSPGSQLPVVGFLLIISPCHLRNSKYSSIIFFSASGVQNV